MLLLRLRQRDLAHMRHAPRNYGRWLYYDFVRDGYPFFVTDGRTQRFKEDDPDDLADNHMLGRPSFRGDDPSQLERLCDWLRTQQETRGNVPKFIVSASVFVPNTIQSTRSDRKKNECDSWPAYPSTRRELLDAIVTHGVQNVVFLSGDIHNSNVAEIRFSGTPEAEKLRALSVTSSAFYWPFFFADGEPSNYVHYSGSRRTPDSFRVNAEVTMDYRAWNFTQEDNYCRLHLDRAGSRLEVTVKDEDGNVVKRGRRRLMSRLTLARW